LQIGFTPSSLNPATASSIRRIHVGCDSWLSKRQRDFVHAFNAVLTFAAVFPDFSMTFGVLETCSQRMSRRNKHAVDRAAG
jgi:hypothetical protein